MINNTKSLRGRTEKGEPNPIDVHVGKRLKLRRTTLGLSQEKLAALLGLTFQQVQKYEHGLNRIGASRIWDISKVLGIPIDFFFEEVDNQTANQSPRMINLPDNETLSLFGEDFEGTDPMHQQETIELVRAYYKIHNRIAAKQVYDLMITLAKSAYYYDEEDN